MLSTPIMASIAVRVLGDDIPGIGIVAVNMDYDGGVMVCGNVIPADDGFYVFSLDTTSRRWQQTTNIMKEVFPLIRVGEVKDILGYCGSSDDVSCPGGKATQAILRDRGIRDVLVGNLGLLIPAQETGMRIHGDFGLNIFNSASANVARDLQPASALIIEPQYPQNILQLSK